MKSTITLCFILSVFISHAQLHLIPTSNPVSDAISKVLLDFPEHFNHIKGNLIDENVQSKEYSSLVNIPSLDSAVIIQNGQEKDNIFSWKTVLFQTDDFEKAKAKFHEYYGKIKPASASLDGKHVTLEANYAAPDEDKRFATILFSPKPETQALKDVVVDLSLQYLLSGWELTVSVYEHKDYGVDSK
jgi:hypothetical protein